MKAREIMSADPACCTPDDTIERAARLMEQHDCGCIPVVQARDEAVVVGVVTDRDIAVRAIGHGRNTETAVRDVMTAAPVCCRADTELRDVEDVMSDRQLRRVLVVDDDGSCIGIIAQADLARAAEERRGISDDEVGRVVERISEPAREPIWRL
jgi:CBS domain-containing protein